MSPIRFDPAAIAAYAEAHTTAPAPYLADLARETHERLARPEMLTGAIEGRLLEFLVWLARPSLVLEIGTYSGYSALSMAAALPPGGRIVSLELDSEHAQFARDHIAASPHADRVEVIVGPALESLAQLDGPFDLVFIDAHKPEYVDYYEAVLPKLGDPGLIVVDNTLWDGRVLEPPAGDGHSLALAQFNDYVAADKRVASVMLTVRDGVTLIRRV